MRLHILSLIVVVVKCQAKCTTGPDTTSSSYTCGSSLLTGELFTTALSDTRTSRNELTDDHVLFQTNQVICLSFDSSFSQHTRCLLEGCSRQEAIGVQRRLGDTQ